MVWKWCWIALRRFHKDKRFRRPVLLAFSWLAYVVGNLILHWKINREAGVGVWTVPFYGLIFGSGFLAFVVIRKVNRGNGQIFKYSLVSQSLPSTEDSSLPPSGIRSYLLQRTGVIGGLVLRASSELSMDSSNVKQPKNVTVRGALNEKLRKSELWNELEPEEVDLFRRASGSWTSEQKRSVTSWCEQLRLLRWTFEIDGRLEPLAHLPKPDVRLTMGVLDPDQLIVQCKNTRELWEVRREKDQASKYAIHIFSELRRRGLLDSGLPESSPQTTSWLDHVPQADCIAGVNTISELDDNTLRSLGSTAVARYRYAEYLMAQLEAQTPISYTVWLTSRKDS